MYSNYLKAGVHFREKFNFADKITQLGAEKNYLGWHLKNWNVILWTLIYPTSYNFLIYLPTFFDSVWNATKHYKLCTFFSPNYRFWWPFSCGDFFHMPICHVENFSTWHLSCGKISPHDRFVLHRHRLLCRWQILGMYKSDDLSPLVLLSRICFSGLAKSQYQVWWLSQLLTQPRHTNRNVNSVAVRNWNSIQNKIKDIGKINTQRKYI